MHPSLYFWLLLCLPNLALGQAPFMTNPSFEGSPGIGNVPTDWFSCHELSTPDTQPGFHDIDLPASDGATYLGLVGRGGLTEAWQQPYNGTVEDARTALLVPIEPGVRYELALDLAHEPGFTTYSLAGDIAYPFPMQLEVYATLGECDSTELLWRSPVIDHLEWRTYQAAFLAQGGPYGYLLLKTAFPDDRAVLGNLIVDHLRLFSLGAIEPQWLVPNVFTPNGDQINDRFEPFDRVDVAEFEVAIFDRWGRRLYQGRQGWDGSFEGQLCPEGVYFYEMKMSDLIGRAERRTGSVTLLR